jgi:hypothetical protein
MRPISEIIAEGEALTAHIEELRTQLHDAEKRLDVLRTEADRAVRATFRGAGGKPKNTRKAPLVETDERLGWKLNGTTESDGS